MFATLHTTSGDIRLELYPNHAPKTVRNFVGLAKGTQAWTDELQFSEPYLLAMANAGQQRDQVTGKVGGTNGSQFFISVVPTAHLNGKHTIFGKVADAESRAVVDVIATTPTRGGDRPVQDVTITSVTVED